MIDEFEAIGLHIPTRDKLVRNIARKDIPAVRKVDGMDALGCFTEESGARALVVEKGDCVELWPTVRSEATPRPANITRVNPFCALVDVFDEDLELTHRLTAGLEDPFRFELEHTAGAAQTYFSALPIEVQAYDSEAEYDGPVPFGAWFVSAPDLFELAEGRITESEVTPFVTMGIRASAPEVRRNEFNGMEFQVLTVSENLPLTVALPADFAVKEGQWLWGTWKLMASLGSWEQ